VKDIRHNCVDVLFKLAPGITKESIKHTGVCIDATMQVLVWHKSTMDLCQTDGMP
jgi:hypothetical protein